MPSSSSMSWSSSIFFLISHILTSGPFSCLSVCLPLLYTYVSLSVSLPVRLFLCLHQCLISFVGFLHSPLPFLIAVLEGLSWAIGRECSRLLHYKDLGAYSLPDHPPCLLFLLHFHLRQKTKPTSAPKIPSANTWHSIASRVINC